MFVLEDVIHEISEKMICRPPHVPGVIAVLGSEEVPVKWSEIKKQEKEGKVC